MAKNSVLELNDLYNDWVAGKIDRRQLLKAAGGLGLSAAVLGRFTAALPASAQDATPAASPSAGVGFVSMNREEYYAKLAVDYPFVDQTEGVEPSGTVIFGTLASSNLTTVNPVFADNFPTQDFMFQVFESLFGLYPTGGAEIVPGLADWFEVAEDGKTYTFHLNPNAVFSDGDPLTAADVEFTAASVMNEALPTSYYQSMIDTVESVTAIDDHTVQAVTVDVLAQIVFQSNFFVPVVKKALWEDIPLDQWQTDGGSTGTDPSRVIGSGPFKFVSTSESEGTTTFARNEIYWDRGPLINELIFQAWPDANSAIEALRSGDIDFYDGVPADAVADLQASEDIEVDIRDTYKVSFYGTNLDASKTTLFQDVAVRQALAYAIDRQSICDNIYLGFRTPANGIQSVLSEAFAPEQTTTIYNYDPAKSAELLDGAGWTVGDDGIRSKDGVKLSFDVQYGSGDATSDSVVAAIQDMWKQVGVDGYPNPVDFDTVIVPALQTTFDFRVVLLGFNWASPNGNQAPLFGTEYKGGGFNGVGYSNPEVDSLFAEADRTLDPAARKDLLIKASNIINDDVPSFILWFRQDLTGYNVRMQNFVPAANGFLWSLPFVTVAE